MLDLKVETVKQSGSCAFECSSVMQSYNGNTVTKLLLIRGVQVPMAQTFGDDVLGPRKVMCADLEVITGCVKPEFAQESLCERNM